MQIIRKIAIALASTLAVATLVAPVAAEPDGPAVDGDEPSLVGKRNKRGKKGKRPSFPMKADKFRSHVEKRLRRIEARIDRKLAEKNLPPEAKARIKAELAKGAAAIRAAANQAAADGTVTRAEAQKLRELAKRIRSKARKGKKAWKNKHGKRKQRGPRDRSAD